jgi:bifunctional non-homologous end joining protein LigD
VPRTAPLAVVGYLPGKGSRGALGSLLVAWKKDGKLTFAGAVGSGLDEATLAALRERLAALRIAKPAFAGMTKLPGAAFAKPELVCEVRYGEVTSAGMLRHPVFVKLRDDLGVEDCVAPGGDAEVADEPVPDPPRPAPEPELRLTRLDKVFWPVEGYTKGDLLKYYEAVWPWLAPYLRDRPLVLTRYPDGIEGKSFYQKNAPEFTPDWVLRERIETPTSLQTARSCTCELGASPARVRRTALRPPDWLILDLD